MTESRNKDQELNLNCGPKEGMMMLAEAAANASSISPEWQSVLEGLVPNGTSDVNKAVEGHDKTFLPGWKVSCKSLLEEDYEKRDFCDHVMPPALVARSADLDTSKLARKMDSVAVESMVNWVACRKRLLWLETEYAQSHVLRGRLQESRKRRFNLEAEARQHAGSLSAKDERIRSLEESLREESRRARDVTQDVVRLEREKKDLEEKVTRLDNERKALISTVIPHVVQTLVIAPEFEFPLQMVLNAACDYGRHRDEDSKKRMTEAAEVAERYDFPYVAEVSSNVDRTVEEIMSIVPSPRVG